MTSFEAINLMAARITLTACALFASLLASDVVSAQTSPVSHWPGEGDANDAAGANHGALVDGVGFTSGKVGNGFSLDGVDDFIRISHSPSLRPGAGSFSMDAWIKTAVTSGTQIVISQYECGQTCPTGGRSLYRISVIDGIVRLDIRDTDLGGDCGNGEVCLSGNALVADGNFHHVALVRDIEASQLRLYVDGTLDVSAPLSAGANGPILDDDGEDDPLMIGAKAAITLPLTGEFFFSGVIDEVRYWDIALSDSEVQDMVPSAQPVPGATGLGLGLMAALFAAMVWVAVHRRGRKVVPKVGVEPTRPIKGNGF